MRWIGLSRRKVVGEEFSLNKWFSHNQSPTGSAPPTSLSSLQNSCPPSSYCGFYFRHLFNQVRPVVAGQMSGSQLMSWLVDDVSMAVSVVMMSVG